MIAYNVLKSWIAFDAMFKNNRNNEVVWRDVVEHVQVKDPNHTALTESNFNEKFEEQKGAHPGRIKKIVSFKPVPKPVAKPRERVARHAAVENYKALMTILNDEAKKNKEKNTNKKNNSKTGLSWCLCEWLCSEKHPKLI
mgnify:CR=1 FL=1